MEAFALNNFMAYEKLTNLKNCFEDMQEKKESM